MLTGVASQYGRSDLVCLDETLAWWQSHTYHVGLVVEADDRADVPVLIVDNLLTTPHRGSTTTQDHGPAPVSQRQAYDRDEPARSRSSPADKTSSTGREQDCRCRDGTTTR